MGPPVQSVKVWGPPDQGPDQGPGAPLSRVSRSRGPRSRSISRSRRPPVKVQVKVWGPPGQGPGQGLGPPRSRSRGPLRSRSVGPPRSRSGGPQVKVQGVPPGQGPGGAPPGQGPGQGLGAPQVNVQKGRGYGQYASCGQAGGLSCFSAYLPIFVILFRNILSLTFIDTLFFDQPIKVTTLSFALSYLSFMYCVIFNYHH